MRERIEKPEPRHADGRAAPNAAAPASAPVTQSQLDAAVPHGVEFSRVPVRDAAAHEHARRGVQGAGGELPFRDRIQRAFGRHDLSTVKAHRDPAAVAAAGALRAEAFTAGEHVGFARAPSLRTAAHEAAHVVQQRRGAEVPGGVGHDGDRHEQHAERVADLVAGGRDAGPTLDEYAGGGRPVFALQLAKESYTGAAGGRSAAIPDLDAKTEGAADTAFKANQHQNAINAILGDPFVQGITGLPAKLDVRYVNVDNGSFAQFKQDATKAPAYWVEIYPLAFSKTLPVLYSTIRHELIHAAQYKLHEDHIAAAKGGPAVGATDLAFDEGGSDAPAAISATEVETHAWEITNAGGTGIDKDFLYTRAVALQNYWQHLSTARNRGSRDDKRYARDAQAKVKALYDGAINAWGKKMDVPFPDNWRAAPDYQTALQAQAALPPTAALAALAAPRAPASRGSAGRAARKYLPYKKP